jgi:hypothetical protein
VVPSSLIIFTLIIDAIHSSETYVITRATRRHIQEDSSPHSHRREKTEILQYGNTLVIGLQMHIYALTHRLQKHKFLEIGISFAVIP